MLPWRLDGSLCAFGRFSIMRTHIADKQQNNSPPGSEVLKKLILHETSISARQGPHLPWKSPAASGLGNQTNYNRPRWLFLIRMFYANCKILGRTLDTSKHDYTFSRPYMLFQGVLVGKEAPVQVRRGREAKEDWAGGRETPRQLGFWKKQRSSLTTEITVINKNQVDI